MKGYAVQALVEEYRSLAEQAEEGLRALSAVEEALAAARLAVEKHPRVRQEVAAAAARLREALAAGELREAAYEAKRLCRAATAAALRELLGEVVEADACPSRDALRLAEAIVEASGPLAPVAKALLATEPRASAILGNASRLASAWASVAKMLTSLYAAAARLEKLVGLERSKTIAHVAAVVASPRLEEALSKLEAITEVLEDAADAATETAEKLEEASTALQECRSRDRILCRWLQQALAELVAAREQLESLTAASSLEALRGKLSAARSHLRQARALLGNASRLAAHLAGHTAPLHQLVREAESAVTRYGLSPGEEQLLAKLSQAQAMEASELGPEELEAAITLCRKRLIRCTLKL